ncbi:hypothetical protein GCM10028868_15490 [Virgibacillus kimchii]
MTIYCEAWLVAKGMHEAYNAPSILLVLYFAIQALYTCPKHYCYKGMYLNAIEYMQIVKFDNFLHKKII